MPPEKLKKDGRKTDSTASQPTLESVLAGALPAWDLLPESPLIRRR